jgi:hypothetical protein
MRTRRTSHRMRPCSPAPWARSKNSTGCTRRRRPSRPAFLCCTGPASSARPNSAGSAGSASAASWSSSWRRWPGLHGTAFLDLGDGIAHRPGHALHRHAGQRHPDAAGRLRELVGVAAHPQNQPRLDPLGRIVVSGYGILQPRVATPLPSADEFTLYHGLFAGQCGVDPYSAASSEVYQDLFGEGSFTGKGLLHVGAVHAVLAGRLPEGQVLSHDLFEGSMARCGAVTDIALIEDAPFHADVAASRVHRWIRGDWQLLPLLLQSGALPGSGHQSMEDAGQPAPFAGCTGIPGPAAAGPVRPRRVAVGGAGAGDGGLLRRAADGRAGRVPVEPQPPGPAPLLPRGRHRPGPRRARRPVAPGATAATGAARGGRHRARPVSHRLVSRRPPAAMDHRSHRPGHGQHRPGGRRADPLERRWWACCCLPDCWLLGHAAPRWPPRCACCGRIAGVDLVRQRRPGAAREQAALPPPVQAHLEGIARDTWRLLRALCHRRRQPPAARQPPGAAARSGGAPDLAHQHRPVPAQRGLRPPVRLDRHRGPAGSDGRHAGHAARGCSATAAIS